MGLMRNAIAGMRGYVPGEQPAEGGYLKLNTNENPYPPSPRVAEALAAEAGRLRLYPDPKASRLRALIASYCGVAPEEVLVGNGSDELLTIAVRTFADAGALVASPDPTYTLYRTLCEIQGARYVPVPYRDDYSLNPDLVPAKARLVFIANPNSPSGTLLPEETLAAVAKAISGVLVVDEAYADFARTNAAGLLKGRRNVVILRTLSKSFSLAGLRVGYALADRGIVAGFEKVKDSYNVGRLAIAGGLAAIEDAAWMRENVRRVVATRKRLAARLAALGFFVFPSEANFVLTRISSYPARQIYEHLKKRRILVRYYDTPRLGDCLRISVGTDEEIERLLEQIAEIIGWKGGGGGGRR
jgi:histidinol-phosphate aminotransferase